MEASASVDLAIGEPPQNATWFAFGKTGTVVKTAQARLRATIRLGGSGALAGNSIKLPVYVELASATAELTAVTCPTGQPASAVVNVKVTPAAIEAWIGDSAAHPMADFDTPPAVKKALLLSTALIDATGHSHVAMTNLRPRTLTFRGDDIGGGTPQTVAGEDFTGSLTRTLVGDLDLQVNVLGFGVAPPAAAQSALVSALSLAAPVVDRVLANTLATLGISTGEADVWVNGVQCLRAVLVQ